MSETDFDVNTDINLIYYCILLCQSFVLERRESLLIKKPF